MPRNHFRVMRSPAFWVVGISLATAAAANWTYEYTSQSTTWGGELQGLLISTSTDSKESAKDSLLREDTQLTQLRGRFQSSGDRIVFQEDGATKSTKCLENLWLQRIMEYQKSEDRKVTWLVNARVTEFSGENFLIIETASKTR